jgi:ankyrin repeat protein
MRCHFLRHSSLRELLLQSLTHYPLIDLLLLLRSILGPDFHPTMFQSIQMGSAELVKRLLQTGHSSVDEKHHISGQTPLHVSAAEGQVETAKVLLGHKADLKSKDTWGFTPLHVALLNNHLAMANFLIKKGADVNAVTEKRMTALHFAVRLNYEERDYTAYLAVLDQLIRRGADVNAKNENMETPLYHAVFQGRDIGVIFLLLNGADPNIPSKYVEHFHTT